MTKKEFAEIATMFKNAYRQRNFLAIEEEWIVWYDCLEDLHVYYLKKAALAWIKHNRFPPTIYELRESYDKYKAWSRNDPDSPDQGEIWQ